MTDNDRMKAREINWSCVRTTACECDPEPTEIFHRQNDVSLQFVLRGVRFHERMHLPRAEWLDLWKGLVQNYTARRLTRITDRLPAIAGLATFVHQRLRIRYLFGLWETKGLLDQLLWSSLDHTDDFMAGSRLGLKDDLAPSWSWASSSATVSIPGEEPMDETEDDILNNARQGQGGKTRVWSLQSISINLSTANLFGPGTGKLTLHSLIVPISVHTTVYPGQVVKSLIHSPRRSNEWCSDLPLVLVREFEWIQTCDIEDKDRGFKFDSWRKDYRIDYEDETAWYKDRQLFFVFGNLSMNDDGQAHMFEGLVVEKLSGHDEGGNRLRRLGYGEGVFLKLDETRPDMRWALDLNPIETAETAFVRGTWECWKELGTWEMVDLV